MYEIERILCVQVEFCRFRHIFFQCCAEDMCGHEFQVRSINHGQATDSYDATNEFDVIINTSTDAPISINYYSKARPKFE